MIEDGEIVRLNVTMMHPKETCIFILFCEDIAGIDLVYELVPNIPASYFKNIPGPSSVNPKIKALKNVVIRFMALIG